MILIILKFVLMFLPASIKMMRKGVFLDFIKVYRANASIEEHQEIILCHGSRIMDKIESGTLAHQTALEQLSEVYLHKQDYEKAWSGFDTALDLFIDNSPDVTKELNRLSFLTRRLARCYYYLGDRQEAVDILTQAVRLGVPPADLKDMLKEGGVQDLERIIEPED